MPRHDEGGRGAGAARWVRRWWRPLAAELVATALLVGLGLAPGAPLPLPAGGESEPPLAHVAMAFGFVVMANAIAFGPTSGAHMNPAVTLGALAGGALRAGPAAAYACAQLAGAALGLALLAAALRPRAPLGLTRPAAGVGAGAAAGLEAALTGLLVAVCAALRAERRPDPAAPIKLGLLVAGLVYAGGAATGASLNPARSFAPALYYWEWEYQWVYWVGPLGGAAVAAALHRFVLAPPTPSAPLPEPEGLPLADKP